MRHFVSSALALALLGVAASPALAADGKLAPGQVWRQESVTGSVFEASYALERAIGFEGVPR